MAKVSKNKPLISIIVPVYNGEKYIEKTLNKLIKIKLDKEIIVINDCSTDNSLIILNKYKKDIKLIDLKENHGASYARNIGLDKAKGKYIGFIDIDDSFESNIFTKMIKKIEKEDACICVCNYDEIHENSNIVTNSKYNLNMKKIDGKESLRLFLIDKISPALWDKVYKRSLLEKIRFNNNLLIGEDILFCLNAFFYCDKVTFINEKLYHYLQQNTSLMHTISFKLLHFKDVVGNIEKDKKIYIEENFPEEFNYFKLEMITRGIHSISSLKNKNNKKQVENYLKEYCDKDNLNKILKCKYFSKSIKIEILILKIFGIKTHLFIMPIYKLIRNKIRK